MTENEKKEEKTENQEETKKIEDQECSECKEKQAEHQDQDSKKYYCDDCWEELEIAIKELAIQ
ncbi:hypothetical protein [endosymbiont GvMRE of Glomus versiforme]|uniref:hypothetical protein n=1 Tax=endosymbiont GvMRE of Glomus versiforme TaxID=2039283 RepID=UPI000EC24629|nr:hypothetical protein [endosymbiont GvMRE of Glomus versiforme]RHZ36704.1 hypothetical protein GvMRE_I2g60 [endosymbiont GvMRE of Glomus versiforme]